MTLLALAVLSSLVQTIALVMLFQRRQQDRQHLKELELKLWVREAELRALKQELQGVLAGLVRATENYFTR